MHSLASLSVVSPFYASSRSCSGAGELSFWNFAYGVTSSAGVISLLMLFAGCSALPGVSQKTPTLHFQTKAGSTVDQKGDAVKPANVSEAQTSQKIPLPQGSRIDVFPATASSPGKISFALASASVFESVTESEHVEGPISRSPPSPVEIARGQATLYSYALAVVLMLLAGLMFYLGHGKAGAIALIGAALVPCAINLLTNTVALAIGGIALTIALTLYAAWHLHLGKLEKAIPRSILDSAG